MPEPTERQDNARGHMVSMGEEALKSLSNLTGPKKSPVVKPGFLIHLRVFFERRERDSNPRYARGAQRFSRPPRSTTPASLQRQI